jgi:hypothetical protein
LNCAILFQMVDANAQSTQINWSCTLDLVSRRFVPWNETGRSISFQFGTSPRQSRVRDCIRVSRRGIDRLCHRFWELAMPLQFKYFIPIRSLRC